MTDERFETYARTYSDMIFRVAMGILKNTHDSEDALQNTLVRFYLHRSDFSDEEHIKAWLIRVSSNEAKRILKKSSRAQTVDLEKACAAMTDDINSRELLLAVMGLDEKYCTPLYLYYYEGYKIDEIAKMLKLNASTVRTRLARAREQLKQVLED